MFEKSAQLTRITATKRLLVAESELNRTEFLRTARHVQLGFRRLADGVRDIRSNASTVLKAVAVFSVVRRLLAGRRTPGTQRPWLSAALSGARAVAFFLLRQGRRKE